MEKRTNTFSFFSLCTVLVEAISAAIYFLHVTGSKGRLFSLPKNGGGVLYNNVFKCKQKVGQIQNPGEPLNHTMLVEFRKG